jgi:putative FmdB family regulatory protein
MPIYEYVCKNCSQKIAIFHRSFGRGGELTCLYCKESDLTRILSSFAVHKSVSSLHEESGEPGRGQSPDYYKDPRNIGRHLEKKFQDMNVEVPSEIKDSIRAAREGALPDSLKDLESASSDSAYH